MSEIEMTAPVLKEMRREAGLSQGHLALRLGCSQAWVSALEVGFGKPSEQFVAKLLDVFTDAGVDVNKWEGQAAVER